MKKILFNGIALLLLPFGVLATGTGIGDSTTFNSSATVFSIIPEQGYTKSYNREFSTTSKGTTVLSNKHGKIIVHTWADKKVKMDIQIQVNAASQTEADKVLNQINVNFMGTNGYVKAETFVGDLKGFQSQSFSVDYTVWIPNDNELHITNKFGDTEVSDLAGNLNANIKYGDIKIGKLSSNANFSFEFCKASIADVVNLSGELNDGVLIADKAKMIQMETQRSACTFRRVDDLRLTSDFDVVDVGVANSVRVKTKNGAIKVLSVRKVVLNAAHTKAEFGQIETLLDADLQYGALAVGKIMPNFENILLSGFNTSVDLGMANLNYCYEVSGNNTDLCIGKSAPKSTLTSISDLPPAIQMNGCFTKQGCFGDDDSKSKLVAKMNFGALKIR